MFGYQIIYPIRIISPTKKILVELCYLNYSSSSLSFLHLFKYNLFQKSTKEEKIYYNKKSKMSVHINKRKTEENKINNYNKVKILEILEF